MRIETPPESLVGPSVGSDAVGNVFRGIVAPKFRKFHRVQGYSKKCNFIGTSLFTAEPDAGLPEKNLVKLDRAI